MYRRSGLIFAPVTARHMSNLCQILPQLVTRQKNVKLSPSKDIKLLKCPSNDMTQSEMTVTDLTLQVPYIHLLIILNSQHAFIHARAPVKHDRSRHGKLNIVS